MAISQISTNSIASGTTFTTPNLGTPSAINLSNATALPASAMPAGTIVQIINQNYGTYVTSSTNNSFVDTGITATITPKFATSKIYLSLSINGINTNTTTTAAIRFIVSDGSNNEVSVISGSNFPGYTIPYSAIPFTVVYSPATTSALTYKIRANGQGQGWQINNYNSGSNSSASGIILMEIAQ